MSNNSTIGLFRLEAGISIVACIMAYVLLFLLHVDGAMVRLFVMHTSQVYHAKRSSSEQRDGGRKDEVKEYMYLSLGPNLSIAETPSPFSDSSDLQRSISSIFSTWIATLKKLEELDSIAIAVVDFKLTISPRLVFNRHRYLHLAFID